MYWRQTGREFQARKGAGNKRALRALAVASPAPGLLAYLGDEPVGWCAVAPRAAYPRLATSRNLQASDDLPVWSVPCFFVARATRRRGLTVRLLRAAARFAWTGFAAAFRQAGFREVTRRSPRQALFRKALGPQRRPRSLPRPGALASARMSRGGRS
jgi:GNAT superfamily N-acetyltransferase